MIGSTMRTIYPVNRAKSPKYVSDDARWQAIVKKEEKTDGHFFYSVNTTGVYCRPSCPSRRPNRENVAFHKCPEEAEKAGFRACKRCDPKSPDLAEQHAEVVATACRMIKEADEFPNLDELARAVKMSPGYFHRLFKAATGLTPKAYANAHRADRVQKALPRRETVTEAIYEAGYNSNGRFYAHSSKMLGMKPKEYRDGGVSNTIRFAIGECSLGSILVASSDKGVCAILMGNDPDALARDLQDRFPKANLVGADSEYEKLVAKVVGFIEAPKIGLDLPLDVRGTAFQRRVWKELQRIPAGKTASYSQVADRIGFPKSARAVAQACGANALAVAIPCHRVLRTDGNISGYGWGVDRKRALLLREGVAA
jgi:AraC family transcriptional regulator, regulatory protein of adaptative response / methylated-DNA-[protein]-cysteine methyltransferase